MLEGALGHSIQEDKNSIDHTNLNIFLKVKKVSMIIIDYRHLPYSMYK
jgi:hypothetical protein